MSETNEKGRRKCDEKVMKGGEKRAGGKLLFRVFESSCSWFEA